MIYQMSFVDENIKIVLMSIREEYYNKILDGSKKYEYRSRYLKEKSYAYVYISKTKKSVVAKITFGMPIIGNAKQIAKLAEKEEPGCYNEMIKYLYNNIGYAIPIESINVIKEIPLEEIKKFFPNFVVPQSYYILDKKPELLSFFEERCEKSKCLKIKNLQNKNI